MATKEETLKFSQQIETLARNKSIPYMEAIVLHCEMTGMEIDIAAKLITGNLKSKITQEAQDLHFLEKPTTQRLKFK